MHMGNLNTKTVTSVSHHFSNMYYSCYVSPRLDANSQLPQSRYRPTDHGETAKRTDTALYIYLTSVISK